jgi:mono/diheme cytochrome c family protein/YHS domain-containing protein
MRHLALALAVLPSLSAQEPVPPPAVEPAPATTKVDFGKQIAPILIGRCIECHGPKEQKGDLRLDARAFLFAEGEEDAWVAPPGKPDDSELVRRLGLPLDDEEIMPAKGEPLTKEQQAVVRQWVAEGAEWPAGGDQQIAEALAAMVLPKITFDLQPVDAAQQAAIDAAVAELVQRGAVVQRVAADTPALDVNLSLLRDKAGDTELALLAPLAPVLVWLNLSRTAATDAGMQVVTGLTALRRVHASNTKLGDAGFTKLASLPKLEYLNAYETGLTDQGLAAFAPCKTLRKVYCWQTAVTADGARKLVEAVPGVEVDRGDYVAERLAAAEREIAEREARNKPVNDVCPVADKPIDAAHWVEHEGKRVAFCCAKCKAAFQKEPGKFVGKLPK